MLKHIALQITSNDLHNFYINILKGEVTHQFSLHAALANDIFGIKQDIDIYYLKLDQIVFELFIYSSIIKKTFNHICIELDNAHNSYKMAKKANYWTYLRKSNNNETYFIKDNNENILELKNKI